MGAEQSSRMGENGQKQLELSAAVFESYAIQLRAKVAWFNEQQFSLSSLESLVVEVGAIADNLEAEAVYARQRASLRAAAEVMPQSLHHRFELFGGPQPVERLLHEAIDEVQRP